MSTLSSSLVQQQAACPWVAAEQMRFLQSWCPLRYEERIEQYEVLTESFAENYEDSKGDLGVDLEAQNKLYKDQEQMLADYAEEITGDQEKYTTDIEEARKEQKKLLRENEGLKSVRFCCI